MSVASVTEWEIEQGLLAPQTPESSALLFVREFPKLRKKDMQKSLAAFTDLTVDGLVDSEAQDLLSGLKTRLHSSYSSCVNQHSVEHTKTGLEPSRKEHAQYLDSLSQQFVLQMKERVKERGGGRRAQVGSEGENWGWLHQEICHHGSVCTRECAVFRGRESLIGKICLTMLSANDRHTPLVLFGPAGVGKTALMCKLAQEMSGQSDPRAMAVLRLLGTSPLSSDISTVLRGVCAQICGAFNLPLPASFATHTHQELVRFFHLTLEEVSSRGEKLVLLLDSLERLSSAHSAHKLHWLPKLLPPNVHAVLSVLDVGPSLLACLRDVIEEPGSFFEVEPVTVEQGRVVMEAHVSTAGRSLQPEQTEMLLRSFRKSGSLVHLRVVLHTALQWTSYTHTSDAQVGDTTQDALDLLLDQLEKKHGQLLVSRALGYMASARWGRCSHSHLFIYLKQHYIC